MPESKLDYKEQLKILRTERGINKDLQEHVKETNKIFKLILDSLAADPKTIIELVDDIKLKSETIFWHVNALRKYGKIIDGEKKGDYWKYVKVVK
jgi:predicted transcriptional regulator